MVYRILRRGQNNGNEWDEFREGFAVDGTSALFGIGNKSEITAKDIERTNKLVLILNPLLTIPGHHSRRER